MLIAHLSYKTITTTFARPPVTNYSNCTSYPSDTCLTSTGYEALIHDVSEEERTLSATGQENILPAYLQLPDSYNLPDLLFYILISIATSEVSYHTICGFLQVYFYILKRAEPETWKCQPQRFLTRSNEVHEIVVGTTNMFVAGGWYTRTSELWTQELQTVLSIKQQKQTNKQTNKQTTMPNKQVFSRIFATRFFNSNQGNLKLLHSMGTGNCCRYPFTPLPLVLGLWYSSHHFAKILQTS